MTAKTPTRDEQRAQMAADDEADALDQKLKAAEALPRAGADKH